MEFDERYSLPGTDVFAEAARALETFGRVGTELGLLPALSNRGSPTSELGRPRPMTSRERDLKTLATALTRFPQKP